jgi:hypothetical protein
MNQLFRDYTAEYQLIGEEEEEEEVYTYQPSSKEMYALENLYMNAIISQKSDFVLLFAEMKLV